MCQSQEKDNDTITGDWNLTATVNMDGEFDVTATANISVSDETFTAEIQTVKIAGQTEAHTINLEGTVVDGNKLVVTNQSFNITVGESTNKVVLNGTFTINDNALSGSGTLTETIPDVGDVTGTFTVSGTK